MDHLINCLESALSNGGLLRWRNKQSGGSGYEIQAQQEQRLDSHSLYHRAGEERNISLPIPYKLQAPAFLFI